jgi:hypothetical protein
MTARQPISGAPSRPPATCAGVPRGDRGKCAQQRQQQKWSELYGVNAERLDGKEQQDSVGVPVGEGRSSSYVRTRVGLELPIHGINPKSSAIGLELIATSTAHGGPATITHSAPPNSNRIGVDSVWGHPAPPGSGHHRRILATDVARQSSITIRLTANACKTSQRTEHDSSISIGRALGPGFECRQSAQSPGTWSLERLLPSRKGQSQDR